MIFSLVSDLLTADFSLAVWAKALLHCASAFRDAVDVSIWTLEPVSFVKSHGFVDHCSLLFRDHSGQ